MVELKLKDEEGNINYLTQTIIDNRLLTGGEFYSGNEKGKISILSKEIRSLIDEEELEGMCMFRFYENITVDGLDAKNVSIGERYRVGETILEVSSIGKRCVEECKLIQSGEGCKLFTNVIFMKIIKGGYVKIGDSINSLG